MTNIAHARIREEDQGSTHAWARLSEADIARILSDIQLGHRQVDIARRHGISQGMVSHLANGKRRRVFVRATQVVDEAARFVRAKAYQAAAPEDLDDVYQEAALAGLETRERYWRKMRGNPFSFVATAAFRETTLAAQRGRRAVSISEGAAAGRVTCDVPQTGYESLFRKTEDGESAEERFSSPTAGYAGSLRGEGARRLRVSRALARVSASEQAMLLVALEGGDLRRLSKIGKVSVARARAVLRALVAAVGNDPVVDGIRRVISAT